VQNRDVTSGALLRRFWRAAHVKVNKSPTGNQNCILIYLSGIWRVGRKSFREGKALVGGYIIPFLAMTERGLPPEVIRPTPHAGTVARRIRSSGSHHRVNHSPSESAPVEENT
jgi:hypothetical protein